MKLIIVDDDKLICDSLKLLLEKDSVMKVIGTASDGKAAIDLCEQDVPDIALMDIRMPGMDGVKATDVIKQRWPHIRVVMLTTFKDRDLIHAALSAGADGYLLKSTPADGIIERLRAIHKGAAVLDAEVLGRLSLATPIGAVNVDRQELLTPREVEILHWVAQGFSNNEIAAELHLSEGTVRNILSSLLGKFNLRDRTQLAVYYWRYMYDTERKM